MKVKKILILRQFDTSEDQPIVLRVNNEQAQHLTTVLGISDVKSFLACVLACTEGRCESFDVVEPDYT